jgi:hypothetical protein
MHFEGASVPERFSQGGKTKASEEVDAASREGIGRRKPTQKHG